VPTTVDKPHAATSAVETGFMQCKDQVTFKFEQKMYAVQGKMKVYPVIPLLALPLKLFISKT
jgi:hypothetical protein